MLLWKSIISLRARLFRRRTSTSGVDHRAMLERQRISYERAMRLELAVYTALNTRSAP